MNVDKFTRQVEVVHKRLAKLYEEGGSLLPLSSEWEAASKSPLLPIAFRELGTASEELQVAIEELHQQNEELAAARVAIEAERQRYQDLFEFAPNGYLVTDAAGKILEANRYAAALLNVSQQTLVGKLLISFVPQVGRQGFRSKLTRLLQQINHLNGTSTINGSIPTKRHKWDVQLQPRNSRLLDTTLTVVAIREPKDKRVTLRWLLHDITEHRQTEAVLETSDPNLSSDHIIHRYAKGESIPLNSQVIWQVRQGLVKLSTFCETGEEILVGLVKSSMLFGPSLTSLQTFQALALSEVQLVSLPLTEIAASLPLAQSLLPQVNQRLRQTELLLAISGERRVQDRLHHLLRVLQQEIGQPTAQGTRLSIRLTHEDLANACCTTRVTITRLLSKLNRQEKLLFCPKRHIILREGF